MTKTRVFKPYQRTAAQIEATRRNCAIRNACGMRALTESLEGYVDAPLLQRIRGLLVTAEEQIRNPKRKE